jgi:predicted urease superfamily metal-dependent hydrolase
MRTLTAGLLKAVQRFCAAGGIVACNSDLQCWSRGVVGKYPLTPQDKRIKYYDYLKSNRFTNKIQPRNVSA